MKFSIVTITYNSEKYLEQTIRSVLSQDHEDFEYLIIDGKSSDSTLDIIMNYAEDDKRIRWISEPDKGIADAMNKGVRLATGEVIAHLHSDDYYPNYSVVSAVNSEFEKFPQSLWLTGGIYIVDPQGKILDDIKVRNYSYQAILQANILLHPATFIKKQAFERVGLFDVSLSYAMDYDLWLRLGAICDPITMDQQLACFRAHRESLSTVEVDAAFDEAWHVRKKFIGGNILRLSRYYLIYKRSRKKNRMYMKNLIKCNKL